MTSKTTNKPFSENSPARCEWFWITKASMPHAGRRVSSIAAKIGCTAQTLHEWVKSAERDSGVRAGVPHERGDKAEGSGTREPRASGRPTRSCARRARILPRRSSIAGSGHAIAFIDDHRQAHGVEPIQVGALPIAPSTHYAHVAKRVDPSRAVCS